MKLTDLTRVKKSYGEREAGTYRWLVDGLEKEEPWGIYMDQGVFVWDKMKEE